MKNLIFMMGLLGLVSCTSMQKVTYGVHVNSINSGEEEAGKRVVILPMDKGISADDLQYREFSKYLVTVLTAKGYVVAKDPKSAEVILLLGYLVSEPQARQATRVMPMTTYNSGQTANYSSYGGKYSAYGTVSSSGSYNTTYVPVTESFTTYTRAIKLMALDARAKSHPKLWETDIISIGRSGDLRRAFPVMMAAASEHIGTNTRQELAIEIEEDDPRIAAISGLDTTRVPAAE